MAFWWEACKNPERAEASEPAEHSRAEMPGDLISAKWLATLTERERESMSANEVHVFDVDVRTVFVSLKLIATELCCSVGDYDGALNVPRAWLTERCVLH